MEKEKQGKIYEKPRVEFSLFDAPDVIRTSGEQKTSDEDLGDRGHDNSAWL